MWPKTLLMTAVFVLLAGCASVSSNSWVAVAAYPNPFTDKDGKRAENTLSSALNEHGIRMTSLGSREFYLCVSQVNAEWARKVIARTIEDQELKARLVQ
jgi:hypothetical protein